MMGVDGMGMGWGAGSVLGPLFVILFGIFLIAGTVWLVLAASGRAGERSPALSILDQRLARGEIDLDEYSARKTAIGGAR
ncbi:MAG TPA: SHOCT domain-containing protein [Candidatus Limnocylindria bacterium]|nr:SHOCT domain-containing protein [Candidatus Limnocylindria bacterium]